MSRILDEFWHATKRAPRRFPGDSLYGAGCDVLGATALLRPKAVQQALAPAPATTAVRAPAPAAPTPITQTAVRATQQALAPTPIVSPSVVTAARQAMAPTPITQTAAKAAQQVLRPPMLSAAAAKAGMAKPQPSKNAKALLNKVNAAANRAIAVGRRLARKHGRAGSKLQAVGKRMIQKAATTIKGAPIPSDHLASPTPMLSQNAFNLWAWLISAVNSLTDAGELLDGTVYPLIEQLKAAGQVDLAHVGEDIASRGEALIASFNDEAGMADDVTSAVAQLRTDTSNWQAQAQAVLSAPQAPIDPATGLPVATGPLPDAGTGSFDPGTPGGGGSGGDPFADEPIEPDAASDATQAFRDSGGVYDPFEEEQGDYDPGALDDARAALEEENYPGEYQDEGSYEERAEEESSEEPYPYMEYEETPDEPLVSDESDAIAQFRESGGAIDPLEDESVLGLDFEWTDLFMPHLAIQRWYAEQQKTAPPPPLKKGGVYRGAASTEAQQSQSAAQTRLAAARRQRAEAAKARLAEVEARLAEAAYNTPEESE